MITLQQLLNADPVKGYVWIVTDEIEFNQLRDHLNSLVQADANHMIPLRERTYQEKLSTWFFGDGFRKLWALHHIRNKVIPPLQIYNPASREAIDVLPGSDDEKEILLTMWREHFRGAPRQRPPSEQYQEIEQAIQYLRITANNSQTRNRVYQHLGKRISKKTIERNMPKILGHLA